MVDQAIVDKVKKLKQDMGDDPKVLLTMLEYMKQTSTEIDVLKEKIENMHEIIVQTFIMNKGFKMWEKIGISDYDYGEGKVQDPSFTISTNWETISGILTGKIDGTMASMIGNIQFDGNLEDIAEYGEYLAFASKTLEEKQMPSGIVYFSQISAEGVTSNVPTK